MFEGLSPQVEKLLNEAAADLPVAQADPGLLAAMSAAVSETPLAPLASTPRSKSVLGKLVTAKAAAVAGALLLSGGVASAATGNLPDPAQDAASSAAKSVGLNIPKSDDSGEGEAKEKEHPDNHGKDVSGVAGDKSGDGDGNHGATVCEVASDGKCKPNADEDNSGPGNAADKRQDGDKRNENSVKDTATTTTSTTVDDDSGAGDADDDSHDIVDDSTDDGGEDKGPQHGKGKGRSGGADE